MPPSSGRRLPRILGPVWFVGDVNVLACRSRVCRHLILKKPKKSEKKSLGY